MADVSRNVPLEQDTVLTTNVRQARIARVYVESLLPIATRDGQAESLGDELDGLVRNVLGQHPNVAAFFTSPALTRRAREPILAAALKDTASPLLRKFVGVLNQNNRLDLLPAIAAAYREVLDEQAGRVRVWVRSAAPLGDAERDELRQALTASLGKEPILAVRVDPELLGGLMIQVGDRVYDSTVRSRLDALRTQLLARGSNVVKA
jgi:F-type H+-transporting ATPase subunit delta